MERWPRSVVYHWGLRRRVVVVAGVGGEVRVDLWLRIDSSTIRRRNSSSPPCVCISLREAVHVIAGGRVFVVVLVVVVVSISELEVAEGVGKKGGLHIEKSICFTVGCCRDEGDGISKNASFEDFSYKVIFGRRCGLRRSWWCAWVREGGLMSVAE